MLEYVNGVYPQEGVISLNVERGILSCCCLWVDVPGTRTGDAVMKIFKRIKSRRSSLSTDSKSPKPMLLEKLEQRILLSGDGLLTVAAPGPIQDSMQPMVQHAELLETNEQIETDHQIQPLLTLSLDEGYVHNGDKFAVNENDLDEEAADNNTLTVNSDLEVAVADELATNSPAIHTEDGDTPIYISDVDRGIEHNTSIEIRGPPADETTSTLNNIAVITGCQEAACETHSQQSDEEVGS